MESLIPLESVPSWYRTPLAQTYALGFVFLFLFSAWGPIQFYAAQTFGEILAANSVSALYASLTLACFVAPSFTDKVGSRRTMAVGILFGFDAFVVFALIYFQGICGSWIVIFGGILLGIGAALLWTAQGRLILEYTTVADQIAVAQASSTNDHPEPQSGKLLGIFWALFKSNSLLGGSISFAYYFKDTPTQDDSTLQKPAGNTPLYLIFLSLMTLSAMMTQLLLPPSSLVQKPVSDTNKTTVEKSEPSNLTPPSETTMLLEGSQASTTSQEPETGSWLDAAKQTLVLFTKDRSVQILALIFFYTGFNQPYQQETYTRFFSKRTIGIQLIIFRVMEIVGAILSGRLLDKTRITTRSDGSSRREANPRGSAISFLCLFLVINGVGNLIAIRLELAASNTEEGDTGVIDITSPWLTFLFPSTAFVCWGFADSQIQVYCYWLLGRLFTSSNFSRAAAFYKCLQSLGYTLGFYLIPTDTRLSAMHQIVLSCGIFLGGTLLAFWQLPPAP